MPVGVPVAVTPKMAALKTSVAGAAGETDGAVGAPVPPLPDDMTGIAETPRRSRRWMFGNPKPPPVKVKLPESPARTLVHTRMSMLLTPGSRITVDPR
jgi:hypothetical protein